MKKWKLIILIFVIVAVLAGITIPTAMYLTKDPYVVSLQNNNPEAGTVSFTGEYSGTEINVKHSAILSFKATENYDYYFIGWYNGDTLISKDLEYTGYEVRKATTITAKYEKGKRMELNDKGFYYDWAYYAEFEESEDSNLSNTHFFIIHKDGTASYGKVSEDRINKADVAFENGTCVVSFGGKYSFVGSFSSDGMTFECSDSEPICFTVGNVAVADEDYVYVYQEDIGGYSAHPIKDKESYRIIPEYINHTPVVKLGNNAFSNSEFLTNYEIPEYITVIGESAFAECQNLATVKISSKTTQIEENAFEKCSSLTTIELPDSVTNLGAFAFKSCSSLTSIRIPKGVTEVKQGTFSYCQKLVSVTVPGSITRFGELGSLYAAVFFGCNKLENVYFEGTIEEWCNIDYVQTADSPCRKGSKFYLNGELVEKIVIPETVKEIKKATFRGCTNIKEVVIPCGVSRIGEYAFYDCSGLEKVTICSSVRRIERGTFYNCSNLSNIIFDGPSAAWNSIYFNSDWNTNLPEHYSIICSDVVFEMHNHTEPHS